MRLEAHLDYGERNLCRKLWVRKLMRAVFLRLSLWLIIAPKSGRISLFLRRRWSIESTFFEWWVTVNALYHFAWGDVPNSSEYLSKKQFSFTFSRRPLGEKGKPNNKQFKFENKSLSTRCNCLKDFSFCRLPTVSVYFNIPQHQLQMFPFRFREFNFRMQMEEKHKKCNFKSFSFSLLGELLEDLFGSANCD